MLTRFRFFCTISGLSASLLVGATSAQTSSTEPVLELKPYTVSADFPAIRVRFVLSRQNLFEPQADPLTEARVVSVADSAVTDELEIKPQDLLVGLNGTPLAGLTLRQLATLVAKARAEGNLVWDVRRGFETVEILHNGDWLTPLPGLTR